MGNHPASVALYDDHCVARGAGFIILFLARKIIKAGNNYGIVSENDSILLFNGVPSPALLKCHKIFTDSFGPSGSNLIGCS